MAVLIFLYIWRMNKKWYISALVVILAFLGGIVTQEHISKPNQEIVLQFTSATVTSDEANAAITAITEQLQIAGVRNLQVTENQNGQLKIVYFSNTDISGIKDILSNEVPIGFEEEIPVQTPSEKQDIGYNLDVFEIQSNPDADLKFEGTLGSHQKESQELILSSNVFANVNVDVFSIAKHYKRNLSLDYKNNSIAFNQMAHKIPEVRAGPKA